MRPCRLPLLFLVSLLSLFPGVTRAFTANDVRSLAGAYNNAFYFVSGTNGYFKDSQSGGISYFWTQAEMMETYIDAYEWQSNSVHSGVITNFLNGFLKNNGSSWLYNIYNDDIMWAVLAFARGGVDTGRTNYCHIAKANFDACYARAWDNVLGGGLYWTSENWTKNACVNGPGAIAAYLLYQIYGDTNYLNKALSIYQWERAVLFNTNSGAVYDAIGTNGVINHWASTYNQGTFIGAAHLLGYTNDARLAANYTMMHLTSRGILPEYGIAGNNSGFNAIFLRWMTRFIKDRNLQGFYAPWLQLNATAAWNSSRASDQLSWCQWNQATPFGTNFYSWDCIASFSALHAAEPTQASAPFAVPRRPATHWPLDETAGTVATNATWNGNHGTVQNGTWNPSGRINGCLNFNGLTSTVQVGNPVVNDFTIAFWVRTTQIGGVPQWYNGAGLVDGDVPFTANDFGTALVGSKFAFGVGNPDVTIQSTVSVNDGSWHHCVATRHQATGQIRVYVDGNLQATGNATRNTLNGPATLRLGSIASGAGYFNGSLDDVRIFYRTLNSEEVSALYQGTVIPPSIPPDSLVAKGANGRVQLTWSEAPLATSYNLKRSLVNGGPFVTITNVASTMFTDTTVLSNRTYYYAVSPVNALGEGADSEVASAVPSSLAVWLRADAISGISHGSPLSTWVDSTGNGYNAIQPLVSRQPLFITNVFNGNPAIRFNASSNSYLWLYRPVQDDFTMIFVFRSSQGLGTGINFWEGAGLINGEQSGAVSDFGLALNANGQILAGVGNPDTTIRSGTGFNNNQPHVVTFKRTRNTGAIALYVDGVLVAAGTGGTQSLGSPNCLVLGAQGVVNNYLSGDFAEVQVYSAALSDAERLGQERALRCKYGIGGGTTPTAPTGLTATSGNREVALNWMLSPGAAFYSVWRSTNQGFSFQTIATGLTDSSHVDSEPVMGVTNQYRITASNSCGAGSSSATVAAYFPLPSLSIQVDGSSLTMAWPEWATDWSLVTATNLTPPILWLPVTNAVGSNDGMFNVTIPVDSENRFFRLASP
jgi:hypothetical protein